MKAEKVLIVGLVWPEPVSSAAGTRMLQLVHTFLDAGYEVVFASAASKSPYSYPLLELGVREESIVLNDASFDRFIAQENPAMVLFDRFMVEEQYGWRVSQQCPDALKILDTEDLHFLRQARQQQVKKGGELDLYTDTAKRELAAILRCDLSLLISELEIALLTQQFRIDPSILYYLPFLEEQITASEEASWLPFEERKDFVFIGNFLHEPNWHAVQRLKSEVWPLLRKLVPTASLHIYGAYASQKVLQLHNPKERFFIMGRAEDARATVGKYRVLVAPLAFGAGVKGKFIDAMQTGTPAVTTSIGAEAMRQDLPWNGAVVDDMVEFAEAAARIYGDGITNYGSYGKLIINSFYTKEVFAKEFIAKLRLLAANLKVHRQHNFIGQVMQHHTMQSTKYMSLWIDEKNKMPKSI